MSTVTAIYKNGLFRPLESVDLPEQTRVSILVSDIQRQSVSAALTALHEVMAERHESGHHDTAERHNQVQP